MTPKAMGIVGHRSRTSKTNAARVRSLAYAAGRAIVRGGASCEYYVGIDAHRPWPSSECEVKECTESRYGAHAVIVWH